MISCVGQAARQQEMVREKLADSGTARAGVKPGCLLASVEDVSFQPAECTQFQLLESDLDPNAGSPLATLTGSADQGKTVTSTHY